MKAQEIRERFANYFIKNGHEKISSSPLIPQNDKTLLFANAGMNQFKDYFTGKATAKNKRAVTIQKVVRAGGKHNDLENVGLTARHHTFFEMLGNFSFGDYFKEDAIRMAWEFLTEEVKLDKSRLYITVHYSDDEAIKIWNEKIGIPLDRIFKKGDKDNFWEMGEYGPCGPCSEIFYDHGEQYTDPDYNAETANDILDDEMRYVEIWNLVFMQYEKTPEGRFDLPKPSIDTGAGLERVAACLQGVYWNYDTDIFQPIFRELESITGHKYGDNEKMTSSMRIVADHIRSTTMLITDGAMPSNEGRGYVLRRIIRRAIRHMRELGAPKGSFVKLVPAVFESLGKEYPQNLANQSLAEKLLNLEEEKFLETLEQGIKFLGDAIKKMDGKVLSGEAAFKLYDTYGFPVDLTQIILEEKGLSADLESFEKIMAERKEESKKSWKGKANLDDSAFHKIKDQHGPTDFTGYTELTGKGKVNGIVKGEDSLAITFDSTPFYAESGGQAGDKGLIKKGDQVIAEVIDTLKPVDGLHVHVLSETDVDFKEGEEYTLEVDQVKRRLTEKNHSATHLLQAALIEVLGDHVKQAGSNVNHERLRFDFTHLQAMTAEEIEKVEELVNNEITRSSSVEAAHMTMDQALESGAMALFGEKYGDEVRVLTMGKFSVELCGGTHVKNTSDIGLFSIVKEESLSSGVRRIEAVSSNTALKRLNERSKILSQLELGLNSKGGEVLKKVDDLQKEIKSKNKEIKALNDSIQSAKSKDMFKDAEDFNGIKLMVSAAEGNADLRKLSDNFVSEYDNGVLIMSAAKGPKTMLLIRASKGMKQVNCSVILKAALEKLGGRGGGKPDMAQGSGDQGENLALAIETAKETLAQQLKG